MSTALQLINRCLGLAGNRPPVASYADLGNDGTYFRDVLGALYRRWQTKMPNDHLRAEGEITLLPTFTSSDSITATSSGSTVTLSAALFTDYNAGNDPKSAWVGGWIWLASDDGNNVYQISAVSSTSVCTVSPAMMSTDTTHQVTGLGQDSYSLPADFDRPLSAESFITTQGWRMCSVDPETFIRSRQYDELRTNFMDPGQPEIYTLWGVDPKTSPSRSAPNVQRLMVAPFPLGVGSGTARRAPTISIAYYRQHTGFETDESTVIVLPRAQEQMLIDRAMSRWFRDQEVALSRAMHHRNEAKKAEMLHAGITDRTSDRAAIVPDNDRSGFDI